MESKKLEKSRKNGAFSTIQGVMKPDEETGGAFPTMKSLDADKKASKTSEAAPAEAEKPVEKIDFSKVKVEPLFEEAVTVHSG